MQFCCHMAPRWSPPLSVLIVCIVNCPINDHKASRESAKHTSTPIMWQLGGAIRTVVVQMNCVSQSIIYSILHNFAFGCRFATLLLDHGKQSSMP